MKIRFLIVVLVPFCILFNAIADEYFKMVQITCAPEIQIFEGHATGAPNIGEYLDKSPEKAKKALKEKYGLFLDDHISQSCTNENGTLKLEIKYRKPSPKGACGGNPGGVLSIYINNKIIVRDVPFHEDCFDVSAYTFYINRYYVEICGGKMAAEQCVIKNYPGVNASDTPIERVDLEKAVKIKTTVFIK